MTSAVTREDHSVVTPSAVRFLRATGYSPVSQFSKPPVASLPASSLPVAAQPASSFGQPTEPIARSVSPMDRVALGSSVQHRPTIPLQDRNVSQINVCLSHIFKEHAPDPVPSVRPIRSADCGHSSAGEVLDFLRVHLAHREEECVTLEEKYLEREDHVVSLESEVESLVQENHFLQEQCWKIGETTCFSRF